MERNRFGVFPPEIWCYILCYVNDTEDLLKLKCVNRLFYHEIRNRDPLGSLVKSITVSAGNFFNYPSTIYFLHTICAKINQRVNNICC